MPTLQDIQAATLDDSKALASILRQCMVLASDLKSEDLRQWVSHELNGYRGDVELPAYRILSAPAVGHLVGPAGAQYQNYTIAAMLLPDGWRNRAERTDFRQSIGELEQIVAKNDATTPLMSPWSGELVALMQDKFGGFQLYAAWQIVSVSAVTGILETVRNRVLEFCLELAKTSLTTGHPNNNSTSAAAVTHLYQTIIMGDVSGQVATGPGAVQTSTVITNDFASLATALRELKVPAQEISTLQLALDADRASAASGTIGPKVASWLAEVAGKVTNGVVVGAIVLALKAYLGL